MIGKEYFKLNYIANWGNVWYGAVFVYMWYITVLLEQSRLNFVIFLQILFNWYKGAHKEAPSTCNNGKGSAICKGGTQTLSIVKCHWSVLVY